MIDLPGYGDHDEDTEEGEYPELREMTTEDFIKSMNNFKF